MDSGSQLGQPPHTSRTTMLCQTNETTSVLTQGDKLISLVRKIRDFLFLLNFLKKRAEIVNNNNLWHTRQF